MIIHYKKGEALHMWEGEGWRGREGVAAQTLKEALLHLTQKVRPYPVNVF